MSITVLVADDADIMRRELRWLLSQLPTVRIVGEASDFSQLVQMARKFKPQIIVMDLYLIPLGHPNAPREIKSCVDCCSQLLAVSFSNDPESKALAKDIGAVRLLDKMNLYSELGPTISQLAPSSTISDGPSQ